MRLAFLALALLMFFAWFGAFIIFHVAAGMIHLLLIVAIILLLIHFVTGGREALNGL